MMTALRSDQHAAGHQTLDRKARPPRTIHLGDVRAEPLRGRDLLPVVFLARRPRTPAELRKALLNHRRVVGELARGQDHPEAGTITSVIRPARRVHQYESAAASLSALVEHLGDVLSRRGRHQLGERMGVLAAGVRQPLAAGWLPGGLVVEGGAEGDAALRQLTAVVDTPLGVGGDPVAIGGRRPPPPSGR